MIVSTTNILVANGTPTPGRINALDMPDDFFRIRLVCNILDTCGMCFDRGTAKKKLDFFLTFLQVGKSSKLCSNLTILQYYIFTKDPMPMDIDFIVQDTFAATRPQWKLATTFEEAGRAFADAVAQNYKSQDPEKTVEAEDADDDASSDGGEEEEPHVPEMDEAHSSSEEAELEVVVIWIFLTEILLTECQGTIQRRCQT